MGVAAAESIGKAHAGVGRNSNPNHFLNRRGIETLRRLTGRSPRDEEVHASIETPFEKPTHERNAKFVACCADALRR